MLLSASSHVKGCDEALAIVDAAVLLTDAYILGYFDSTLDAFDLGTSTQAFLSKIFAHLKLPSIHDTGVRIIATVSLALGFVDLDSTLDPLALETIKGAGSLALEAGLKVASSDEAFSEVNATVLLTNAHFSSHYSCNC